MRMETRTIVVGSALVAAGLGLAFTAAGGGYTKEGLMAGARITARWSFLWFMAAWTASALARLWPGGWRTVLLRRRRAVGIAFAADHFVHLGFVLAWASHEQINLVKIGLLDGWICYLLIGAMAVTSHNAAQRWMGMARWRWLQRIGGWLALYVFFHLYSGRLADQPATAGPAVALIVAAVALRAAAWLKGRRSQAQAA